MVQPDLGQVLGQANQLNSAVAVAVFMTFASPLHTILDTSGGGTHSGAAGGGGAG